MTQPSLTAFAAQGARSPLASNGNTPGAHRYAQVLRDTVIRYASQQPRSVQRRLGPSELGLACDRNVIGKMARALTDRPDDLVAPDTNHVSDPWASIVGTAIHAYLDDAFTWDSEHGPVPGRWLAERRVIPDPRSSSPHPGTADLYDRHGLIVVDHKGQSRRVRDKLRRHGPPQHYFVQMLLYALGYMNEGYQVNKVALVSWPRTESSLDDLYVWEHDITAEDLELVQSVLGRTALREQIAVHVAAGDIDFMELPATPSDNECHYCPFYRSDAARNPEVRGCPGTLLLRS